MPWTMCAAHHPDLPRCARIRRCATLTTGPSYTTSLDSTGPVSLCDEQRYVVKASLVMLSRTPAARVASVSTCSSVGFGRDVKAGKFDNAGVVL